MSHDYGKSKNRKKPAKKNQRVNQRVQVPGWILFGSGVAFAFFAQFLFHVATVKPDKSGKNNHAVNVQEKPEPKKPTINFYNQLKNMDVPVPSGSNKNQGKAVTGNNKPDNTTVTESRSATTSDNKSKSDFNQMLQAGSYKTHADADEQRAALSLLGMKTSIEVKPNVDGTTYYRVIIGPFSSAIELEKARSILNRNNVPTITVRR